MHMFIKTDQEVQNLRTRISYGKTETLSMKQAVN